VGVLNARPNGEVQRSTRSSPRVNATPSGRRGSSAPRGLGALRSGSALGGRAPGGCPRLESRPADRPSLARARRAPTAAVSPPRAARRRRGIPSSPAPGPSSRGKGRAERWRPPTSTR
jgi:hypothetical protein